MTTGLRATSKEKNYAGTTDSTSIIWTPKRSLGGGTTRMLKPRGIVWWSGLILWIAITRFWRLGKWIIRVTRLGAVFVVFNAGERRSIFGCINAGTAAYHWPSQMTVHDPNIQPMFLKWQLAWWTGSKPMQFVYPRRALLLCSFNVKGNFPNEVADILHV